MAGLTLRLLGNPTITLDDDPIEVDTRKAIALLVYLAITRQEHRRSSLAVLFWPDSDQERARTALRRTLATLNKAIGKGWINADRKTIGLNWEGQAGEDLWVDVHQLHRLLARSEEEEGDCQAQLPHLQKAAALYQGDFMLGFTLADSAAFDEWQFFQSEQAKQEIGEVWQRLIYCLAETGQFEDAIGFARQWLALDTLYERPHRQLMQLYAWSGQRSAALRQYEECKRLLEEELGVPPQPETTAIYEQIVARTLVMPAPETAPARLASAISETESRPPRTTSPPPVPTTPASRPRHNLPASATLFIGREREQLEVLSRLDNDACRLLTITGPGGVGKTRMALEVARQRLDHYEHGVYFVPLAEIGEAGHLIALIADAIHFAFYGSGDQLDLLIDHLQEKEMLLVLDNFEHVLDASVHIADILRRTSRLQFLITSQERLNLREEWLYSLDAFSCPEPDQPEESAAYQLFVERARQIRPAYSPTEQDKTDIVEICRRVDGLALGIELAATWVRILPTAEIVAQMQQSLDFLESTWRNVPQRQRSLRALFAYSWRLLTDQERQAFSRLGVFSGSFDLAAALRITGVSLPSLLTLADKSLLRGGEGRRHSLPAALRPYALERFDEDEEREAVQERFFHYYLHQLANREAALKGGGQKAALAAITQDIENVRLSWRLALERGAYEQVAAALPALLLFYEMRNWFAEGEQLFAAALESDLEQEPALQGALLCAFGACQYRLARFAQARSSLAQALACTRQEERSPFTALTLYYLGLSNEALNDYKQAEHHLEESLDRYRAEGDEWGAGNVLNALGNVAFAHQEYEQAQIHYKESLALRQASDDRHGIAICIHNLGNVPLMRGDYAAAREWYQRSLRLHRELNDERGIGNALNNLGYTCWQQGDLDEAQAYLSQGLEVLTSVGDERAVAHLHQNLGHVSLDREQFDEAEAHYQESLFLFQRMHDRAGAAGVLASLGDVARQRGESAKAWEEYRAALELAGEIDSGGIALEALAGLAALLAARGRQDEAAHLATFVAAHADAPFATRRQAENLAHELPQPGIPSPADSLPRWIAWGLRREAASDE